MATFSDHRDNRRALASLRLEVRILYCHIESSRGAVAATAPSPSRILGIQVPSCPTPTSQTAIFSEPRSSCFHWKYGLEVQDCRHRLTFFVLGEFFHFFQRTDVILPGLSKWKVAVVLTFDVQTPFATRRICVAPCPVFSCWL